MKQIVHLFLGGILTPCYLSAQEHFRFAADDISFSGFDVDPVSLLQGGWTIDYATPDYEAGNSKVGFYVGGIFRTPIFDQPGSPQDNLTGIEGFAFGGDQSAADFTAQEFFPLATMPNSYTFVWKSPSILVKNDSEEAEEVLGLDLPAGSDSLLFSFERLSSTSRGGFTVRFDLLLADPSGNALDSDALPTNIKLEDFSLNKVVYFGRNVVGSGTFAFQRDEFSIAGPLSSFERIEEPFLSVTASPTNEGLIGYPVTFELSSPAKGGETFSFALESDQANVFEDFLPYSDFHEFAAGETTLDLVFTLKDDAVIEPDESFNLVLSDAVGLHFEIDTIPLTILNDDTLLDDYGARYGLNVEERMSESDDDGDGLKFIIEYGFNLDPTRAEAPCYVPGLSYQEGEAPSGLPLLVAEGDTLKYVFPRRTDAVPRIDYFAEVSADGLNFSPVEASKVTPLTNHWEEVEILLREKGLESTPKSLIRVRMVSNE